MKSGNTVSETAINDGLAAQYDVLGRWAITDQQAEIFHLYALDENEASLLFNQSVSIEFLNPVSEYQLKEAIELLFQRHESLRSVFDAQARQILVLNQVPMHFQIVKRQANESLSKLNTQLSAKGMSRPFDLSNGDLHRFTLVENNGRVELILVEMHQLICDNFSLNTLVKELSQALSPSGNLDKDSMRYSDFIEAESRFHHSIEFIRTLDYWKERLNNFKFEPYLPYKVEIPESTSRACLNYEFKVSKAVYQKIKNYAQINGVDKDAVLMSVFEILWYRKSGAKSMLSAISCSGQLAAGMDGLVGHCLNVLPVFCHLNEQLSFASYVRQRHAELSEDAKHKRITFGHIIKYWHYDRHSTIGSILPVLFNFNEDNVIDQGRQHEFKVLKTLKPFCAFDVSMDFMEHEGGLRITCDYNQILFETAAMHEMFNQFQFLLMTLPENDQVIIENCDVHDVQHVNSSLSRFNATRTVYTHELGLLDLFTTQVNRVPDKVALKFESESMTYQALDEAIFKRAQSLLANGFQAGNLAGVMLDRGPEMLVQMMAILKAGGSYLPIDKSLPKERIQYMLEDANAGFLIVDDHATNWTAGNFQILNSEDLSDMPESDMPMKPSKGMDIAYVLYTSGSTGKPKGVPITNRSLVNLLLSMQSKPGFSEKDVLLSTTTFSFDISGLELYLPLISGGTLVLGPSGVSQNTEYILKTIEEEGVTVFQATPATYKLLLNLGFKGNMDALKLLCGGEALGLELAREILPKCKELWNMYGPTETTIWSSIHQIKASDTSISIGRPINNTEILILDEQHRPVPLGSSGEIAIAGDGLTSGYLNNDAQNASKFIVHPFDPQKKIYLTGDIGYVDSNNLLYCNGRKDFQVKIRGYRIETGEIENVILSSDNYHEAVVVPIAFAKDDTRLVAFIKESGLSLRDYKTDKASGMQIVSAGRDESEYLRELCRRHLPEYMLPASFVFVNSMPLTHNAKTDRVKLSHLDLNVLSLYSDKNGFDKDVDDKNVWTETEMVLKTIWESALRTSDANKFDDFFESGGHSMVAIELMHDIEVEFGVRLPLSALFKNPNISGLAGLIDGKATFEYKYLVPIKPGGSKPPLFIIHGAGLEVMVFKEFSDYMDEDQPVIGIQAMGLYSENMPPERLEEIAAEYLGEIKKYNKGKSYIISGFSAGSLLAYEICRQLEQAGEKVALCGIFDYSLESTIVKRTLSQKLNKKIKEYIPRTRFALKMLFTYPAHAIKYQRNFLKLSCNGLLLRLGLLKSDLPADHKIKKIYELTDHFYEVFSNYQLKPYNGTLHIFRSKIKMYYLKDSTYLGWKPYALKGVIIHEVEGNHDNMLIGKNSKRFASTLQRVVNQSLDELAWTKN